MVQLLRVERFFYFVGVDAALRNEVFFRLVLSHYLNEVGPFTRLAEEYFALAILNVFLDV